MTNNGYDNLDSYAYPNEYGNVTISNNTYYKGRKLDEILDWASDKMNEEEELKELCEQYPALKKAKEQFETIKRLVQE
jgi:hypothetical protein